MTNKLVVALTYYNCPLMLREQMRYWQQYSDDVASQMKVILIDDGSMLYPAEHELTKEPLKITVEVYRIKKDIPQNTFGARNLAFHIASVEGAKWVFCTDIDHVLPSAGLSGFSDIKARLLPSYVYNPARFQKQGESIFQIGRHSDTYLISPNLYWQVGGYDEELGGYYYNGAARMFRRDLSKTAKGIDLDIMFTIFHPSSEVSDASPLEHCKRGTFSSKLPDNKKPSVLNFEWERVI